MIITLACVSILHAVQPYRDLKDNAVAVYGQTLLFLWIFLLLLRIVRVGEGGPTVVGCVALVAATIGLFAFALHAIYSQLNIDTSAAGTQTSTSFLTSDDEVSGDGTAPGDNPITTVEVSVVVSLEEKPTATSNTKSPWELLGLSA